MIKDVPHVLFNASVVLAGLKSPPGGSGKLLSWTRHGKIKGVISEIILDEVLRNAKRIGLTEKEVTKKLEHTFIHIYQAPDQKTVEQFKKIVIDLGDAHVLATAKESRVDFLVTLDKKHLLQEKVRRSVKKLKIMTPGEFLQKLVRQSN